VPELWSVAASPGAGEISGLARRPLALSNALNWLSVLFTRGGAPSLDSAQGRKTGLREVPPRPALLSRVFVRRDAREFERIRRRVVRGSAEFSAKGLIYEINWKSNLPFENY